MSFTTIPFEILIEICGYLQPSDLYTLTTVCKRYRTLLWNKTSTTTQLIWRNSRKRFILGLNLGPPNRMSEQEFIWLMVLLKKCMFCDQSDKFELTMHWEFKMYCCFECLNKRTISQSKLLDQCFPVELLACLPQLQRNQNPRDPPIYLKKHVENLLSQYNNYEKDKQKWLEGQQNKMIELNLENEQYNTLHDHVRYDHTERLERLLRKLHDFYSDYYKTS